MLKKMGMTAVLEDKDCQCVDIGFPLVASFLHLAQRFYGVCS